MQHNKCQFVREANSLGVFITAGLEEEFRESPLNTGADALKFTDEFFEFRDEAIEWFLVRFGLDFRGAPTDPATGISAITGAILLPVYFNGNRKYRIVDSNTCKIQTRKGKRPLLTAIEWDVAFTAPIELRGTYGAASPGGVVIAPAGSGFFFAHYRFCSEVEGEDKTKRFLVEAKSRLPNEVSPARVGETGVQVTEHLLLRSREFGEGSGILRVIFPSAATSRGRFPWSIRNHWNFKFDAVYPEITRWDQ